MDCKNAQTLIAGYLDRELDPVRTLEIEDHLHGCAVCSQSYKDHQVLSEGLRTGSVYFKAPADLQKRIQRAVRQAAKAESAPRWLSWSWVKMAAPLAAAALVLFTLIPFLRGPSTQEILTREVVSSHVRSLMAEPFSGRSFFGPAHGKTLVQRQSGFFTASGRSGCPGISVGRWPSRLSEQSTGRGSGLPAGQTSHQCIHLAFQRKLRLRHKIRNTPGLSCVSLDSIRHDILGSFRC